MATATETEATYLDAASLGLRLQKLPGSKRKVKTVWGEAAIGGQSVVCSAKEQFALSMRGQRNCFVACDTFEYPAKEAALPIPEYGMRWPEECSSTRDATTYF